MLSSIALANKGEINPTNEDIFWVDSLQVFGPTLAPRFLFTVSFNKGK